VGTTRRAFVALAAPGLALLRSAPARAAWPERPIRVIVPFTAGGNTDVMARLVAEPMAARLGRPLVVENRPGGGGTIGAEAVARAQPDGYTVLLGSGGTLTANPVLQARLPYDAERDFRPVGLIGKVPLVLVAGPRLRQEDWPAVQAAARAQPGGIAIASPGTGSVGHLALELLMQATGARFTHVPYRGGGALVPDLIAGNVDAAILELTTALPLHQDGKARILAVAATARWPQLPGTPSFIEAGVPGFTATSYGGMMLPARTPDEVASVLQNALAATLAEPAVQARLASLGAVAASGAEATPEGFAGFLREELAQARRAAELAGLKPE
jgi:tripartite-type tricarboxylate transporter receptor subunit TctC